MIPWSHFWSHFGPSSWQHFVTILTCFSCYFQSSCFTSFSMQKVESLSTRLFWVQFPSLKNRVQFFMTRPRVKSKIVKSRTNFFKELLLCHSKFKVNTLPCLNSLYLSHYKVKTTVCLHSFYFMLLGPFG